MYPHSELLLRPWWMLIVMAKDRKSFNVQMQPHYELLLRPQSVIQSLLNQSFSTQWPSFALKATGSLNIEHWIEHWYEHCTFNIEHWYELWMNIEHLTLIIEHFMNIVATICYLLPSVSATFTTIFIILIFNVVTAAAAGCFSNSFDPERQKGAEGCKLRWKMWLIVNLQCNTPSLQ